MSTGWTQAITTAPMGFPADPSASKTHSSTDDGGVEETRALQQPPLPASATTATTTAQARNTTHHNPTDGLWSEYHQNEGRYSELQQGYTAMHHRTTNLPRQLDSTTRSLDDRTSTFTSQTQRLHHSVAAAADRLDRTDQSAKRLDTHAASKLADLDDIKHVRSDLDDFHNRIQNGRRRATEIRAKLAGAHAVVAKLESDRRGQIYFRRILGIIATIVLSIGGLVLSIVVAHSQWEDGLDHY